MNATITQYDSDGKPTMWATVPQSMLDIQQDNIVFGRVDPVTEYVLDRTIVPRPTCPAVLSGATLTGLPVPSTLTINGQDYAVTDSSVTLDFPHPGQYAMTVSCWPYLDANFSVRV